MAEHTRLKPGYWKCVACLDELGSVPVIVKDSTVCRDCFVSGIVPLFEEALKDETKFPVRWGVHALDIEDHEVFFDEEFLAQFKAKAAEFETPILSRVYCQNQVRSDDAEHEGDGHIAAGADRATEVRVKICSNYVGRRESFAEPSTICTTCHAELCVKCSKPLGAEAVDVHECKEDDMFEGMELGVDYQVCPNPSCRVLVSLEDGCNHVKCLYCRKTEFCFICGEEAEHSSGHWSVGMQCPRWGRKGVESSMFDRYNPLGDHYEADDLDYDQDEGDYDPEPGYGEQWWELADEEEGEPIYDWTVTGGDEPYEWTQNLQPPLNGYQQQPLDGHQQQHLVHGFQQHLQMALNGFIMEGDMYQELGLQGGYPAPIWPRAQMPQSPLDDDDDDDEHYGGDQADTYYGDEHYGGNQADTYYGDEHYGGDEPANSYYDDDDDDMMPQHPKPPTSSSSSHSTIPHEDPIFLTPESRLFDHDLNTLANIHLRFGLYARPNNTTMQDTHELIHRLERALPVYAAHHETTREMRFQEVVENQQVHARVVEIAARLPEVIFPELFPILRREAWAWAGRLDALRADAAELGFF